MSVPSMFCGKTWRRTPMCSHLWPFGGEKKGNARGDCVHRPWRQITSGKPGQGGPRKCAAVQSHSLAPFGSPRRRLRGSTPASMESRVVVTRIPHRCWAPCPWTTERWTSRCSAPRRRRGRPPAVGNGTGPRRRRSGRPPMEGRSPDLVARNRSGHRRLMRGE
jgi:hypothetical protein